MRSCLHWIRSLMLAALLMGGAWAQAAPITQVWINLNPDADFGLFDTLAFRFVSQSPTQTGFNNVIVQPTNGWVSTGFDPQLTYAVGSQSQQISFSLLFDGAATDQVEWEVWYYRNQGLLGGGRYVGDVGRTNFQFLLLNASANPPPAVPEPGTVALCALALLAAATAGRRRRQGR